MNRLPKLTIMRDGKPISGEVWVVDENSHCVASFRIKRPECHIAGATSEIMDAGLNLDLAKELIGRLMTIWNTNTPNA